MLRTKPAQPQQPILNPVGDNQIYNPNGIPERRTVEFLNQSLYSARTQIYLCCVNEQNKFLFEDYLFRLMEISAHRAGSRNGSSLDIRLLLNEANAAQLFRNKKIPFEAFAVRKATNPSRDYVVIDAKALLALNGERGCATFDGGQTGVDVANLFLRHYSWAKGTGFKGRTDLAVADKRAKQFLQGRQLELSAAVKFRRPKYG